MPFGNATLLYHLAIGLADVGVLAVTARFRKVALLALALMGLLAVYLAGALGEDPFGAMRLLAWGMFLHGFLVLSGLAVLARRRDRRGALVCAGAAIVLELIALDAFVVEPRWTTRTIDLPELRLTGLSLADSSNRRLAIPAAERYHVVLGHSPDFALGDVDADLLVAGHTHGGQVRLPVLGPPFVLSAVPRAWAAGVTDLGHGRTLIVSRGIGMERGYAPRLRFLCRPEMVVIRLVPGD